MSANATGTPSTNYSIPKFNTASDAPNGKGVNEMMDAIDTLLVAGGTFVTKPAGISVNDVPVWNGTTWVHGATYSSYTPTWSSTGTAPAIGNATVIAEYAQIGKVVHAYGRILFGTTSTFGTGNYNFLLPVTASGNSASNSATVGSAWFYHSATAASYLGQAYCTSTAAIGIRYPATYGGTDSAVGQLTPWTWATSDQIHWNFTYEAA